MEEHIPFLFRTIHFQHRATTAKKIFNFPFFEQTSGIKIRFERLQIDGLPKSAYRRLCYPRIELSDKRVSVILICDKTLFFFFFFHLLNVDLALNRIKL